MTGICRLRGRFTASQCSWHNHATQAIHPKLVDAKAVYSRDTSLEDKTARKENEECSLFALDYTFRRTP